MSVVVFSNETFNELHTLSKDKRYIEVLEILNREHPKDVEKSDNHVMVDMSESEAQRIADVAIIEHIQAGLIYPYWSDDHPKYDESHEEAFFEVQSFLQAVLFSVSGFDIKTIGSND